MSVRLAGDGGWSPWQAGGCSVTCGDGMLMQHRKCNNPLPRGNGATCSGEDFRIGVPCNLGLCIADGMYIKRSVVDKSIRIGCLVIMTAYA